MIKSQDVQKVVDTFNSIKDQWSKPDVFDMYEARLCGTVHCAAGWFAHALNLSPDELEWDDFTFGALRIAEMLGFKKCSELTTWAMDTPELWGNPNGENMFFYKFAYESDTRPQGAQSMLDVVDHWQELADRLRDFEGILTDKEVEEIADQSMYTTRTIRYCADKLSKTHTVEEVKDFLLRHINDKYSITYYVDKI